MIPREMSARLKQAASWLPIVSVTGSRQSGKSTLVRAVFPEYEYVNLERPDLRASALEDPVGFIENHPSNLIIDEAQYAPELFSMIQAVSDERDDPGQYILTGSQNFLLLKQIQQSLAGRVGILYLLPLSYSEAVRSQNQSNTSIDEFMFRGGYPRLYSTSIDQQFFFDGYLETYLERDVAEYLDVRNLTLFRKFLRVCAQRVGSLVNISGLASATGVSFRTARSWISILESSHILVQLMPYYTNSEKRLTKTPKLYFTDTGLLCYLLEIQSLEQLLLSENLGAVFENLIISERVKHYLNAGKKPKLYFYRDDSKREIDLLDYTNSGSEQLIEIKSGKTFRQNWGRHLIAIGDELGIPADRRLVVYRGLEHINLANYQVVPVREFF